MLLFFLFFFFFLVDTVNSFFYFSFWSSSFCQNVILRLQSIAGITLFTVFLIGKKLQLYFSFLFFSPSNDSHRYCALLSSIEFLRLWLHGPIEKRRANNTEEEEEEERKQNKKSNLLLPFFSFLIFFFFLRGLIKINKAKGSERVWRRGLGS